MKHIVKYGVLEEIAEGIYFVKTKMTKVAVSTHQIGNITTPDKKKS